MERVRFVMKGGVIARNDLPDEHAQHRELLEPGAVIHGVPTLRVARARDERLLRIIASRVRCCTASRITMASTASCWGNPVLRYHFEFTTKRGHPAPRAPSEDDLLVFYLPHRMSGKPRSKECGMRICRGAFVQSVLGPAGLTFEDPDGYRVVLQNSSWDR